MRGDTYGQYPEAKRLARDRHPQGTLLLTSKKRQVEILISDEDDVEFSTFSFSEKEVSEVVAFLRSGGCEVASDFVKGLPDAIEVVMKLQVREEGMPLLLWFENAGLRPETIADAKASASLVPSTRH
jgi:hypothetical protein